MSEAIELREIIRQEIEPWLADNHDKFGWGDYPLMAEEIDQHLDAIMAKVADPVRENADLTLRLEQMREGMMEAYQFIYPITQGERVDELWLDAAKDWCEEQRDVASAPPGSLAREVREGIKDAMNHLPDSSKYSSGAWDEMYGREQDEVVACRDRLRALLAKLGGEG